MEVHVVYAGGCVPVYVCGWYAGYTYWNVHGYTQVDVYGYTLVDVYEYTPVGGMRGIRRGRCTWHTTVEGPPRDILIL